MVGLPCACRVLQNAAMLVMHCRAHAALQGRCGLGAACPLCFMMAHGMATSTATTRSRSRPSHASKNKYKSCITHDATTSSVTGDHQHCTNAPRANAVTHTLHARNAGGHAACPSSATNIVHHHKDGLQYRFTTRGSPAPPYAGPQARARLPCAL